MIRKRKNINVRLKNIVNEKYGRRKVAFESHFSPSIFGSKQKSQKTPSLFGSKQKAGKSRPCLAQPSLTIFGVCPRAGMIRSIRSVVLNFRLDVFTQG